MARGNNVLDRAAERQLHFPTVSPHEGMLPVILAEIVPGHHGAPAVRRALLSPVNTSLRAAARRQILRRRCSVRSCPSGNSPGCSV